MGDFNKKTKRIKQKEKPKGNNIVLSGNPERYYNEFPSWCFSKIDEEQWAFTQDNIKEVIWTEIFPFLKELEKKKWHTILVEEKKKNHSIKVNDLNKIAQDRLAEKHIEAESIISLRITATHRLYGYIVGKVFNILWYDNNHGDNENCVCRSHKRHT